MSTSLLPSLSRLEGYWNGAVCWEALLVVIPSEARNPYLPMNPGSSSDSSLSLGMTRRPKRNHKMLPKTITACTLANADREWFGEMSYRVNRIRRQTRLLTCNPVNVSSIVPPSVAGSFTPEVVLRRPLASARRMKPVARIPQAFHRLAALCYPSPSRVWDRAAGDPKTCVFVVSAVSRLASLSCSFRYRKVTSLSGHLDWTVSLRSPHIAVGLSPIVRRDLRHAVQANWTSASMISALDWSRMVRHVRTSRPTPSLNFSFRASPEKVSAEPSLSIADFFPAWREDLVRLTSAKPALACAMRWIAI